MKIEFYEEFPKKENLNKLKLINFPTRLFVATDSVEKFQKLEKEIKRINKKIEIAYWSIIKNSYWISPFSNTKDLIELFKELEKIKNNLLIDLELPLSKKWKMYLKNIFHFRKNKRLIKNFLDKNKHKITTAQYPSSFVSKVMRLIGLNYNTKTEKSLMLYTSMLPKRKINSLKKEISKIKDKSNYSISLGTIATGILGNEPILSPKKLEEDLKFVKNAGFKKVIIFRLGGLNKRYVQVLNKFI